MDKYQLRNSLLLLLTAIIWGVAFVAQSVGMDYVGPFTFTCVRSLIGGVALLPVIWLLGRRQGAPRLPASRAQRRLTLVGGACCGLLLSLASCFQQFGILYTSVGKTGFITAFYIIIVPVLGLFMKKKCAPTVWVGVALALVGLYLLCMTEDFRIQMGDFLVFICALLFAGHILVIDYFTQRVDGVQMSCVQFFVCGLLSGAAMLVFEQPSWSAIAAAWQPIAYAGLLSSGVGYTLQIVGQKHVNPTVASLILSLESVVAVLAGLLILGQQLSTREVWGCAFMFLAIVLAQLPARGARREAERQTAS